MKRYLEKLINSDKLSATFFLLPAILGSLVFKPKIKPEKYLVVHLSETCAEQQILSELFRIRWYGMKIAEKIIFLTDDLSDTELERLAKEYKSDITEFKNGVFNER